MSTSIGQIGTALSEKTDSPQDLEGQTPVNSTDRVNVVRQNERDEEPKDPNLVSFH